MDDRFGVPGEWPARERMAEHLPAGCGLGFFFAPVSAWSTIQVLAAHRVNCGGAADEVYPLITYLPLLAIGYGIVFTVAFAALRRVAEGWVALVVAVLLLAAVTAVTGSVLPGGSCAP